MNGIRHYPKVAALFMVLVVLALSFTLAQAQDDGGYGSIIDRLAEEGLTGGDNAILEEFIADDYVIHTPFGELNRDAVIAMFAAMRAAMTDFNFGRELILEQGNLVSTHSVATGIFENEFNGPIGVFPPTGQPFRWEIINIFRFNDEGKVQEEWAQFDTAALFAQLGVAPAGGGISQETAQAFADRFDTIFDGANVAVADEIFSPEFVAHLPLAPQLDREGWKAYVASFYGAFSDLTQEVNQVIAAPDRVILHVTYTGTHDGPLFGIPATGNSVVMDGVGIFSFDENGLATENWAVLDVVGLLAQIGAFPPVAAEGEGVLSEEEAAHFVERLTALFDGPNFDIADEIFAPEFAAHLPLAPDLDLEAWKAYVASFYVGIPDLRDQVKQVIIGSDRLVLHSTYGGTHTGVLFGVPGTGNPVAIDGISVFRFNEAGLVVEAWAVIDVVGLLAQIGAFPPAAAE